jgi:transcriptional regulator of arginine metabolism
MLRTTTENNHAPARRDVLAKIIREQAVGRQAELVDCCASSASSDPIEREPRFTRTRRRQARRSLRAARRKPAAEERFLALKQFVSGRMTAGANLTVLKTTDRVGAERRGRHRRRPQWPEVIGTISGDDTIFIATAGAREQRQLGERLRAIFGR